uniref:DegT/DnrJ/EryC1/StrS aminotransferase family protein n=1 Tax=candidate division CPR3 bacterium TaxID=2268181 RepID=A0A7V3JA97_UNCC3
MKINFTRNSYIRFYKKHKKEIHKAISRCLNKGSLIMESEVKRFEKNFAKFCNRKYCLSVASGTDALKLACHGRKVHFISKYRYRLPIKNCKNSRNIVVTYMNSVQPNFEELRKLKKKHNFFLIEDACQAVGRPLIGDISCFSFYPAKILGGIGKGGALVTDNKKIYQKLKKIRDDKWNNIWLDEVHAAFLNVKLKYLPQLLGKRQKIADYYNKHLPKEIIWNKNCLQNYLIVTDRHNEFIKYMRKKGIEVISDKSDFYEGNLKNAVRIPIYSELTLKEIKYVVKTIKEFFKK